MNSEIKEKIKKSLVENKSKKYFFGDDFNVVKSKNSFIHYQDELGEMILPQPSLIGDHQIYNISTSIAASRKIFNISESNIKNSMKKMSLKGRLEEIKSGKLKNLVRNNRLILDSSHNPGGSKVLNEYLQTLDCNKHVIIGMMANKNHEEYISYFKNISSLTTVDIPNQPNAISGKELKEKFKYIPNVIYKESIQKAIQSIKLKENDLLLITGSLYLSGEFLNIN